MSNVHFIKLSDYQQPKSIESKNKEWVEFGDNNNYFQYLIDRYNFSTTNNAVINNIVKLAYGKGLKARNSKLNPERWAKAVSLFKKDAIRKVILDFKVTGNYAFQVGFKNGSVVFIDHIPIQLLRAEKCNEKGEIEAYYYSDNWEDTKKFVPKRIPAFGRGGDVQILWGGNYTIGQKYYSNVDYIGALPYCKLEEEIAHYLINEVENGFSPSTIVNFNNGVPDLEGQEEVTNKVKGTLTGSRGKKVIVAFNNDETKKTTIDSIPLDNAPEHYSYLSEESMRKIMLGHNVTSPLIFGIATTTGFSSNADELRNSFILYENMVIKPFQESILTSIDTILMKNDIVLDLYFETLQPLDSQGDLDIEEEEKTQMQSQKCCLKSDEDLSDEEMDFLSDSLQGEKVDDEWELVDKRILSDENQSIESWAQSKIKPKETLMQKLSRVIKSAPSDKSSLDKDSYKVRYEYSELSGTNSSKSREFCKKMMQRTANGVVYRKEDIDQASFQGVNNKFGHERQNYSLWLYKGGKYCHHFWTENLYRLKTKTDGTPYADKSLSSSEEVSSISGYNPKPNGLNKAKTATINQPNRGEYPK